MMEAVFRAEKGVKLLFLTILADTHCVCFTWWSGLWVVDAVISHATRMFMVIVLVLCCQLLTNNEVK
jgi:hypothetical protein